MKEVNEMKNALRKLHAGLMSRKGQSLVEYALILALIAVVAIVVLKGLGSHINNTLSQVNANLP
jgi:Flp pilus assembly pilin Flp